MACGDSASDVRYEDTNGDFFYFHVVDDDGITCDNYTLSHKDNSLKERYIKNKDNYFLLVKHGELCFKPIEKQELSSSDCKFNIQTFRRDKFDRRVTVILYVVKNGKYKLVCCDDDGKVHVDTKDSLPGSFEDNGDKALFFLKSATRGSPNTFKFVPSLCKDHLLAFEREPNDCSLLKLAAHMNDEDEVDECSVFHLTH